MNAKKTGTPIEKIKKVKSSAKKVKPSKNDVLEKIINKSSELTNTGIELGKIATLKIDESAKSGINKVKSNDTVQSIVQKTSEVAKTSTTKDNSAKLKKIPGITLEVFEKFVGTIRKGTQYGKTSLEMLGDLAKMKELGIISEEEYESKKKQILSRI